MYLWIPSLSLKCAIDLEIPDIIHKHGQPLPLSQLVSALNIPPSKATFVKGLMRLLALNGIFTIIKSSNNEEEESDEAYDLTSASQLLVNDTDHCLSPMVGLAVKPPMIELYHHLKKWARREENTLDEAIFGVRPYDLMKQKPEDFAFMQEAMASDSRFMKLALTKNLESVFDGLGSIVDVGGGDGTTAKTICEAFPKLKCIVLDLPEVVSNLSGTTNLSFVGGNMLNFIPHADAVLIKWVLLDWGDDDIIKILKNAKDAISSKGNEGKVIVIDMVLDEKHDQHEWLETKLLLNLILTAQLNSKARSEKNGSNYS
ncbi:isoflavone 7-O-methyltransferase-like [Prosopis cineraria]|uniref:isoflavone 7-O-methyltransferase-like n=1 Tax=Prosopis cineraria TaxID=364024 RepID=UPI00240EAF46|nr:isoflavone 7-O-methyltransferase-like [Prosopis cineraria]